MSWDGKLDDSLFITCKTEKMNHMNRMAGTTVSKLVVIFMGHRKQIQLLVAVYCLLRNIMFCSVSLIF